MTQQPLNPVISTKTASHYYWGENCDGWWLKKNGRFTVISEIMPKGTSGPEHLHHESEQFFYVLEGTLNIELDGISHHLHQHESLTVMPRTVHLVFNPSDQEVRFLVISCPDSHEDSAFLQQLQIKSSASKE